MFMCVYLLVWFTKTLRCVSGGEERVETDKRRGGCVCVCACVVAGGVSTMHFWAELLTAGKD